MLKTADWTIPTIGGFLSESIEKEERHLARTPPRYTVKNVWRPEELAGRPTEWKDVKCRPQGVDAMHNARSKLGMNAPVINDADAPCRSNMFAARRTRDTLAAIERDRAADAISTEVGFKSPASLFTAKDLQDMKPSYSQNETCATETTGQLIGFGAKQVPLGGASRYSRQRTSDFVESNNQPNRSRVEAAKAEAIARSKPWRTPLPPSPFFQEATYATAGTLSFFDTFKRPPQGVENAFCVRPGDVRIV